MPSRRNSSATPSASAFASGEDDAEPRARVAFQIIERLQDDRARVRGQIRRHEKGQVGCVRRVVTHDAGSPFS
jgi:hypothetical protein